MNSVGGPSGPPENDDSVTVAGRPCPAPRALPEVAPSAGASTGGEPPRGERPQWRRFTAVLRWLAQEPILATVVLVTAGFVVYGTVSVLRSLEAATAVVWVLGLAGVFTTAAVIRHRFRGRR